MYGFSFTQRQYTLLQQKRYSSIVEPRAWSKICLSVYYIDFPSYTKPIMTLHSVLKNQFASILFGYRGN